MKNKKIILIGIAVVIMIGIGLKLSTVLSDSIGPSIDNEFTGLSGSGFCGKILEKWKFCERNEDCLTTQSVCKWPMTYNTIYKSDVEKINSCMGQPTNCAVFIPGKKFKSVSGSCHNNKCELVN